MYVKNYIVIFSISFLLIGCSQEETISIVCKAAQDMTQNGNYEIAIVGLNSCINSRKTKPEMKRYAYLARAWSYFNLKNIDYAIKDHKAAFEYPNEPKYEELINYALYLKLANKFKESLSPIKKALEIDTAKGELNMMTQYHYGWSLQELNRHQEAIDAFSLGIPTQPDFIYVYYRRGLSFEAIGKIEEAIRDFDKAGKLYKNAINKDGDVKRDQFTESFIHKLMEYGLY